MRYLINLMGLVLVVMLLCSGCRNFKAECTAGCENMRKLGCEEGEPLEDGTTCEAWCTTTMETGIDLNPDCMAEAKSCDQAELEACGEE